MPPQLGWRDTCVHSHHPVPTDLGPGRSLSVFRGWKWGGGGLGEWTGASQTPCICGQSMFLRLCLNSFPTAVLRGSISCGLSFLGVKLLWELSPSADPLVEKEAWLSWRWGKVAQVQTCSIRGPTGGRSAMGAIAGTLSCDYAPSVYRRNLPKKLRHKESPEQNTWNLKNEQVSCWEQDLPLIGIYVLVGIIIIIKSEFGAEDGDGDAWRGPSGILLEGVAWMKAKLELPGKDRARDTDVTSRARVLRVVMSMEQLGKWRLQERCRRAPWAGV